MSDSASSSNKFAFLVVRFCSAPCTKIFRGLRVHWQSAVDCENIIDHVDDQIFPIEREGAGYLVGALGGSAGGVAAEIRSTFDSPGDHAADVVKIPSSALFAAICGPP